MLHSTTAHRASLILVQLTICALMLMTGTGCETVREVLANSDRPTARLTGASLRDLSLDGVDFDVGVEVSNPYSVPLPIAQLEYALAADSTPFVTGQSTSQGVVPAKGSRILPVRARVVFADLLNAVGTVRPGQVVPYTFDGSVSVDTDALGRVSVPLQKKGTLPIPAVPDVSLRNVEWDAVTWNEARATLNIDLSNTNEFPLSLRSFDYALSLAGVSIIETSIKQNLRLRAGGKQTLKVPISISPSSLGTAAFQMLLGNGANYQLSGNMSVGSSFGDLSLPVDVRGETPFAR